MAYTKTIWEDGQQWVDARNLNNMEKGIETSHQQVQIVNQVVKSVQEEVTAVKLEQPKIVQKVDSVQGGLEGHLLAHENNTALSDNSITPSKLSDVRCNSNNLFNKNDIIKGYYLNVNNGELVSHNPSYPYVTSCFIPIISGTKYCFSRYDKWCLYDSNKIFIKGGSGVDSVIATSNSAYIKVSVELSAINSYTLCRDKLCSTDLNYSFTIANLKAESDNYKENSINKKHLSFEIPTVVYGKNLFNKSNATYGYYVNKNNGNLSPNNQYWDGYASDFISVKANDVLTRNNADQCAFYDIGKNFISGSSGEKTIVAPSDGFFRFSISKKNIDSTQLEYGNKETPFEPYHILIENLKQSSEESLLLSYLPNIYVAKGSTVEIYNKQLCVCGNIHNYHFMYKCQVGVQHNRKYSIDTTKLSAGNYPLTVLIYDNNFKVVKELGANIIITDKKVNKTSKTILAIGDSLTDIDKWRREFKKLADQYYGVSKINYIGTKGRDEYKHEGYSGWRTDNFVQNSTYTYGGNIILNVTGVVTVPSSKKVYTIPDAQGGHHWEVEKCEISNGSGKIYFNRLTYGVFNINENGTITATNSSSIGDDSIRYTSFEWQKGNPFWNTSTSDIDFNNYLAENSFSQPDYVTIMLGSNDVNRTSGGYEKLQSEYQISINNIKRIIDKVNTQWASIKILLMLPPYYANQNGLGKSYPNSSDKFEFQQNLKIYTFTEILFNTFKNYKNVTIVPVAQTMDSEYVYGQVSTPVNPRMTDVTTTVPSEAIHPQTPGFEQIADSLFSTFVYLEEI